MDCPQPILEDGSLDPSFDGDGKVLTDIASAKYDMSLAIAIDNSGRIIVAGSGYVGDKSQMALARYRPDGALDPTFDGDGKVLTNLASADHEWASAIAIDSRNRIVAAGHTDGQGIALARVPVDGGLDTTFDIDGKVLTVFSSAQSEGANAIVIDESDRVVVAGDAMMNNLSIRFALARYRTDGSLDSTFHEDGKVLTAFDSAIDALAYALAIDDSGRIVVAGRIIP